MRVGACLSRGQTHHLKQLRRTLAQGSTALRTLNDQGLDHDVLSPHPRIKRRLGVLEYDL